MNSSESTLFSMTDSRGESILIKAVIRKDTETIERLLTIKKDIIKID